MKNKNFGDKKVVKIDLSGGIPAVGFESIYPKSLSAVDAAKFLENKIPLKSDSVTLLMAGHLVEHINPANKGFIKFMNECWRVLKVGGQLMISTPYAGSTGYWADPTHVNGCNAQTWYYFDPTSPTGLYTAYNPKPWKTERCFFQSDGVMEVLLIKLSDSK
jgi:SAM-dependent methyltransferase